MQKEKMEDPKVSVWMITFNHERFVAQAIESVLMQKTEFPVELVIGEDCSTDGTRAICEHYAREYPGRVRLLPSERNLGMQANARRTLEACSGKYIAMCEGDDYWTDPQKLQKQVDILANDSSLAFCFHNVEVIREGDSLAGGKSFFPAAGRKAMFARPPDRVALSDILGGNFISTLSVLARTDAVLPIPRWIDLLPAGDWGYFIHWLQQGAGAYLDQIMGGYRMHAGGVWSGRNPWEIAFKGWKAYEILLSNLGRDLHAGLEKGRAHLLQTYLNNVKGECTQRLQTRRSLQEFREYIAKHAPPDLCPDPSVWRRIRAAAAEDAFYCAFHAGNWRDASRLLRKLAKAWPSWFLRRGSAGVVAELMRRRFRGNAMSPK